ncbi:unnamed protein product, partial [Ectocarpus sp. 8 AP-2014]
AGCRRRAARRQEEGTALAVAVTCYPAGQWGGRCCRRLRRRRRRTGRRLRWWQRRRRQRRPPSPPNRGRTRPTHQLGIQPLMLPTVPPRARLVMARGATTLRGRGLARNRSRSAAALPLRAGRRLLPRAS